MIIQVRGTSGCGKSWIIHQLMKELVPFPAESSQALWIPVKARWKNKKRRIPLYYVTKLHNNKIVAICGGYEAICGGCDNVGSAKHVFWLYAKIRESFPQCHIISEGLLLSEDTKWTIKAQEMGWDPKAIFLTTEIDTCIQQINDRRKAVGKMEPIPESNTRRRVEVINRAKVKLKNAGVWSHAYPTNATINLIKGMIYAK